MFSLPHIGYIQQRKVVAHMLSVTADGQTTTQTVYATYNQGGELATLTYPDGETVTSTYDMLS